MQPYKIEFYAYCNTEDEAETLSKALYDFVALKRSQGIAVTAEKMTKALTQFKDNFFVNNYLK